MSGIKALFDSNALIYASQGKLDLYTYLHHYSHIKLPDAIIWATAYTEQRDLITYNARDFAKLEPAINVVIPNLS